MSVSHHRSVPSSIAKAAKAVTAVVHARIYRTTSAGQRDLVDRFHRNDGPALLGVALSLRGFSGEWTYEIIKQVAANAMAPGTFRVEPWAKHSTQPRGAAVYVLCKPGDNGTAVVGKLYVPDPYDALAVEESLKIDPADPKMLIDKALVVAEGHELRAAQERAREECALQPVDRHDLYHLLTDMKGWNKGAGWAKIAIPLWAQTIADEAYHSRPQEPAYWEAVIRVALALGFVRQRATGAYALANEGKAFLKNPTHYLIPEHLTMSLPDYAAPGAWLPAVPESPALPATPSTPALPAEPLAPAALVPLPSTPALPAEPLAPALPATPSTPALPAEPPAPAALVPLPSTPALGEGADLLTEQLTGQLLAGLQRLMGWQRDLKGVRELQGEQRPRLEAALEQEQAAAQELEALRQKLREAEELAELARQERSRAEATLGELAAQERELAGKIQASGLTNIVQALAQIGQVQ